MSRVPNVLNDPCLKILQEGPMTIGEIAFRLKGEKDREVVESAVMDTLARCYHRGLVVLAKGKGFSTHPTSWCRFALPTT